MGKIVGIDLGTTNTVVCAVMDGQPVVIKTSEGLYHIPSVVCYDTSANEYLIGDYAKNWSEQEPENTVYSIKRLMGMLYFDEVEQNPSENQEDRQKFLDIKRNVGYRLSPDPKGKDDGVRIWFGDDRYLTPEDISAKILRRAKDDAEAFLGEDVTGAVITVPAYFEDKQTAATMRAGELAGLEVKRLLEEPSAAAISVGFRQNDERRYVLVYDLGGGTFDVSLLQVQKSQFRVRNLGGDNWLGGDNFDAKLTQLAADHVRDQHQYDPINDRHFLTRIKPHVETAKITLTDEDHAVINAMNVCQVPVDDGKRGRPINILRLRVDRNDFENRIQDYVAQTRNVVDTVLREVDVTRDRVDQVVLAGGSTYIPCVREMMEREFPDKVMTIDEVNPMHCVAEGAALFAHKEEARAAAPADNAPRNVGGIESLKVSTTTGRSLGIAARSDDNTDLFQIIVPRGTRLPMKEPMEQRLTARKPDHVCVPVYAGENPHASKNRHQGNIDIDLSKDPVATGTPVNVGLRLTEDRLIEVTVMIEGRAPKVGSLTYGEGLEDVEWKEELEGTMQMGEAFLAEYEEYLSDSAAEKLRRYLSNAEEALDTENRREGRRLDKRITREVIHLPEFANLLFQAERLEQNPALSEKIRDRLGMCCHVAKTEYRQHKRAPSAETQESLREMCKGLEMAINLALREMPRVAAEDGTLEISREARL